MSNKRLLKIANEFTNSIVVDIGSDHALLPIYLLNEKVINYAYVIEVNEGPMNNAIKNIEKHGLTENAKVILEIFLFEFVENLQDEINKIATSKK